MLLFVAIHLIIQMYTYALMAQSDTSNFQRLCKHIF